MAVVVTIKIRTTRMVMMMLVLMMTIILEMINISDAQVMLAYDCIKEQ